MPVKTRLQIRRDTASNWASVNPTLASGEIGYETDTGKLKIGNGSSAWGTLAYTQVTVNGTAVPIGGTSTTTSTSITSVPTSHAATHAAAGSDPITSFGAVTATGTLAMGTNNITGTGTVSATTFSGQLSGTIASSTTATTQSSGDNSTKVATTAYVNAASSAAVPTGSVFQWVTAVAPAGYLLCDGTAVSRTTYAALFAVMSTQYGVGNGTTTFNLPNLSGRTPVGSQTPISLGTATITTATPAVVTLASHNLATGQIVYFTTTGALPTGLTANTRYWVNVLTSSTFRLSTSLANAQAGTSIATTVNGSGTHTLFSADFELGRSNGEKAHAQTTTELATHTHTQTAHTHAPPVAISDGGSAGQYRSLFATNSPFWSMGDANNNVQAVAAINQNSGLGLATNNMQPYIVMNFIIKT